jgi:hypothetical protein
VGSFKNILIPILNFNQMMKIGLPPLTIISREICGVAACCYHWLVQNTINSHQVTADPAHLHEFKVRRSRTTFHFVHWFWMNKLVPVFIAHAYVSTMTDWASASHVQDPVSQNSSRVPQPSNMADIWGIPSILNFSPQVFHKNPQRIMTSVFSSNLEGS